MSRGWEGIQRQIDLGVEKSQDKCLSILEVRRAGLGAPSRWPEPRSRRAGSFPCTHPLTPPLGLDSPSAASQTMDSLISDLDPLKDWKVLRQACFLSLPSLFQFMAKFLPTPTPINERWMRSALAVVAFSDNQLCVEEHSASIGKQLQHLCESRRQKSRFTPRDECGAF